MTGLYQNVSSFVKEKSLTFLCRAPKIFLKELNLMAISNFYVRIFGLKEEEGHRLAKFTKGYAYAYQLLGDILFTSGDYTLSADNISKFDETIYERAYSIIYSEFTPKEREILLASLEDNANGYIVNKIGISKSQLSNYKKVLNQKGLIEDDVRATILKLPRFRESLLFMKAMEE